MLCLLETLPPWQADAPPSKQPKAQPTAPVTTNSTAATAAPAKVQKQQEGEFSWNKKKLNPKD